MVIGPPGDLHVATPAIEIPVAFHRVAEILPDGRARLILVEVSFRAALRDRLKRVGAFMLDGREHVRAPAYVGHVVIQFNVAEQVINAGDLRLIECAVNAFVAIEEGRVVEFHGGYLLCKVREWKSRN